MNIVEFIHWRSSSINVTAVLASYAWTCSSRDVKTVFSGLWGPVTAATWPTNWTGQSEFPGTCWWPLSGCHVSLLFYLTKSHPLFTLQPPLSISPSPSCGPLKKKKPLCHWNHTQPDRLRGSFERASLTESISLQSDLDCWRWASLERTLGGDRP